MSDRSASLSAETAANEVAYMEKKSVRRSTLRGSRGAKSSQHGRRPGEVRPQRGRPLELGDRLVIFPGAMQRHRELHVQAGTLGSERERTAEVRDRLLVAMLSG